MTNDHHDLGPDGPIGYDDLGPGPAHDQTVAHQVLGEDCPCMDRFHSPPQLPTYSRPLDLRFSGASVSRVDDHYALALTTPQLDLAIWLDRDEAREIALRLLEASQVDQPTEPSS